jgi:hypothetical protein
MPSTSGILPFTQEVLNTTTAINSQYINNPSFGTTGTPAVNVSPYVLQYDSASISMVVPRVLPPTNLVMVIGATAPVSVNLNTNNNYGAVQGNAMNPCGKLDAYPPAEVVRLYQNVLKLAAYVPARI